jgi:ubiquinone/menaquinone biosynthesis C-methylase UbiE
MIKNNPFRICWLKFSEAAFQFLENLCQKSANYFRGKMMNAENDASSKKCDISDNSLSKHHVLTDDGFLAPDVPISQKIAHQKWQKYLYEIGNKHGMRILEIGSREVSGQSHARQEFMNAQYVGFDFYPGRNVDVVGDAHKLSSYFGEEEKFDIIYSSACFEHFAMPWIVAVEIAKLLKIGGLVFIETHFSFSSHERPWHFFQFSDMALKILFSEALGFECIEAGMSNPIVGRFSYLADEYLRNKPVTGLYCHSEYLGKKVKEIVAFSWEKLDLIDVVGETTYPQPNGDINRGDKC